MSPVLEALTARAFARAPAAEANAAIARMRAERGEAGAEALSYEVVVPGPGADAHLLKAVLPRLVYFLDCRGVKLPRAPGIFVSLFTPEGLFFLDAGEAVAALGEAAGLSLDELVRRYGESGAGDPPLLGP